MKKFILLVVSAATMFCVAGCESVEREIKSIESEMGGGLERKITAYSYNGDVLYQYEGKVDVQMSESRVLFDTPEGKRVVLYNAIVVSEEQ